MKFNQKKLTIISRKSPLAVWQSQYVKSTLQSSYPDLDIEVIGITTTGDATLDKPLNKIGGKGLFVKELEIELLNGNADIAVHSMKDVPSVLPDGLEIPVILERADPRDVFISKKSKRLHTLEGGSTVGTSSLRRQAQVLSLKSDLQCLTLRGNVDTRIKKWEKGEFDAIILAAAGISRLGLTQYITEYCTPKMMLPGVGQGALGIECRTDDMSTKEMIQVLHHARSYFCVMAERSMNALLGGSCLLPVAGLAEMQKGKLHLTGLVASPDGQKIIKASAEGKMLEAKTIGERLANQLLKLGAEEIIERANKHCES